MRWMVIREGSCSLWPQAGPAQQEQLWLFRVGAAAASTNYCAVRGAASAEATEPKVVPKAGLSEGPSAEQGVQGV